MQHASGQLSWDHHLYFWGWGTTMPRACASLIIACSVTATAPIVVIISTVFSCASTFAKSVSVVFCPVCLAVKRPAYCIQ